MCPAAAGRHARRELILVLSQTLKIQFWPQNICLRTPTSNTTSALFFFQKFQNARAFDTAECSLLLVQNSVFKLE